MPDFALERYFARNQLPMLWFGEPSQMDHRLAAQSGLFVVPGVLDQSIDQILQRYGGTEELLHQFILSPAMREEAINLRPARNAAPEFTVTREVIGGIHERLDRLERLIEVVIQKLDRR